MINPYAEFEIIDQFWKRRAIAHNAREEIQVDYDPDEQSSDDSNEDIKPNEEEVTNSMALIDTSKLPTDRVSSGLNYIGECDNHIGICNRGYDEDIRPNEDQEDGEIICNTCSQEFEYETMILHD
eukprot:CAMPEP_0201593810 /NCGR_PEP_ID=MMETSP0190_2-20130828/191318_1 /ASSEMBLY_ACC=CAM_ASM_000263 /TAXON_ID=37353 /ORGANISM="Rosalina sp." /LENGTH=124 /DNA_ID=CAMNT_0048053177 /DNA_START=2463 /DNA_END=2834 /DNA_ORIENTATION=+